MNLCFISSWSAGLDNAKSHEQRTSIHRLNNNKVNVQQRLSKLTNQIIGYRMSTPLIPPRFPKTDNPLTYKTQTTLLSKSEQHFVTCIRRSKSLLFHQDYRHQTLPTWITNDFRLGHVSKFVCTSNSRTHVIMRSWITNSLVT